MWENCGTTPYELRCHWEWNVKHQQLVDAHNACNNNPTIKSHSAVQHLIFASPVQLFHDVSLSHWACSDPCTFFVPATQLPAVRGGGKKAHWRLDRQCSRSKSWESESGTFSLLATGVTFFAFPPISDSSMLGEFVHEKKDIISGNTEEDSSKGNDTVSWNFAVDIMSGYRGHRVWIINIHWISNQKFGWWWVLLAEY